MGNVIPVNFGQNTGNIETTPNNDGSISNLHSSTVFTLAMTSLRKDIAMGTLKLTVQEKEDAEKVISRLGKCYDLIDNNKPFANSGDYVLFYLWYTGNEARQDIKNYFIDVNFELREKYLLEKIGNYFKSSKFRMDKAFTNYFKELSTTFPNAIDDTLKKEFPARISLINSFTT